MEVRKIFVGIDFSSSRFDAAVHGGRHSVFSNDDAGYSGLLEWLALECPGTCEEDILFCGENTGNYSLGLSNYLYAHGYEIWIENPLHIKRSLGLVRGKDDKADSYAIARYAARNFMDAVAYEPPCSDMACLRELFTSRRLLVSLRTSVTNSLKGVRVAHAANGFGSHANVSILEEEIEGLDGRIKELQAEMLRIINRNEDMRRNYGHITSVKGVGAVNAAALIIVTGNFAMFSLNARKLACHVGVAPFRHESGSSVKGGTHVSSMSNHIIKPLLTQAAMSAIRFNPKIATYYQGLRERGKAFQVALNNVKNKLLHIIIALIRKDEDYEPSYQNGRA